MLAFDRFRSADETFAGQRRGDQPVHGCRANLIALVPATIDEELQRPGRLAGRHAEGGSNAGAVETKQFSCRGGRPECAGGGGWMKTTRIMGGRIKRVAKPAADFEPGHDCSKQFLS